MGNATCFNRVTSHLIPSLLDGFIQGDLISSRRMCQIVEVRFVYGGQVWEHEFHFNLDEPTYDLLRKFNILFRDQTVGIPWFKGAKAWSIFYAPHDPIITYMEMQAFFIFLWVYNLWIVPTIIAEMVALNLSPIQDDEATEMNLFIANFIRNDLNIHRFDEYLEKATDLNVESFLHDVSHALIDDGCCCMSCKEGMPFLFELFLRASWADNHRRQLIDDELFRTLSLRNPAWMFESNLFHPVMQYTMNGDSAMYYGICGEECSVTDAQKYHFKIMEMLKVRVLDPLAKWINGEEVKPLDYWEDNLKIFFNGSLK